jgi:hypothetical protein
LILSGITDEYQWSLPAACLRTASRSRERVL